MGPKGFTWNRIGIGSFNPIGKGIWIRRGKDDLVVGTFGQMSPELYEWNIQFYLFYAKYLGGGNSNIFYFHPYLGR